MDLTITENGQTLYLDDDGRPIYPCTTEEIKIINESKIREQSVDK